MPNLLATFTNMQRFAGVMNLLLLLMPQRMFMPPGRLWESTNICQLLQHFSELQKIEWLTVIASTLQQKLGKFFSYCCKWSIMNAFYSAEIICWVTKSKQPIQIVNNLGFQSLMKTGQPRYHIPSPMTVSRDVKQVFLHVCSYKNTSGLFFSYYNK